MDWHNQIAKRPTPCFVRIIDDEIEDCGYVLEYVGDVSSIIINKGGKSSMVEIKVVPIAGFEELFDILNSKRENIESEKSERISNAIAEIESEFKARTEKIDSMLSEVSEKIEIEVPDEAEISEEASVKANVEQGEMQVENFNEVV